jgi:hypothetical protein
MNRSAVGWLYLAIVPVYVSPSQAIVVPVVSTYDSSLDGWTAVTGDPAQVTWQASDGNPGGYAGFTDISSDFTFIRAPSIFLGDWSNLNGAGVLSWEHRIFQANPIVQILALEALISGPGGSAHFRDIVESGPSCWVAQRAPLHQEAWVIDSGTWSGILAAVTAVDIRIETVMGGTEMAGIDNVVLADDTPVNVPTASAFNTSVDGWCVTDVAQGPLDWVSTGGHPGGYAQFTDVGEDFGFVRAPASFTGDWSSMNNIGVLSWDHRIISIGNVVQLHPLEARLSGPGGTARYFGNTPSTTSWVTQDAVLQESLWIVEGGTWAGLLAYVTDVQIRAETAQDTDGPDVEGLDNIRLSTGQAVPAVSTWGFSSTVLLLLIAGSIVLARSNKGCRQARYLLGGMEGIRLQ